MAGMSEYGMKYTVKKPPTATLYASFSSPGSNILLKNALVFNDKQRKKEAQRLINLEIPVLVRSLKSSNVELG